MRGSKRLKGREREREYERMRMVEEEFGRKREVEREMYGETCENCEVLGQRERERERERELTREAGESGKRC